MFALNLTHQFNFTSAAVHWSIILSIGVVSLGLVLGFLTPILTVIAGLAALANLLLANEPTNVVYIFRILIPAALFFLGPGAYSVDAKLFGLRVTVVQPRKDKNLSINSIE